MNEPIKKPKGRRGASLMIALVIFLLCALAGASAFLMAASNAGRYSHSDEQDYYSASSAALMLVDMLDGLTYESETVSFVYKREWEYINDKEHTVSDEYTLTIPNGGDWSAKSGANTLRGSNLSLCKTILGRCNALVPYLVPGEWYDSVKENKGADVPKKPEKDLDPVSYKFTVTVPDDNRFGTINCSLVMNTSYDLNFTFSGENGEYPISVYWQAMLTANKTAGKPVYDYTTQTGGEYKSGSLTQTDKLSVTAKWDKKNVTISRGAVQ